MDVQDMRIFARVAAVQNLSQVGTELSLTPGTISKRLQALEDDLGAKLFDRTTRSMRITEEGEKLLEYVERILRDIEGARAAVGANTREPRGRLRVCAPLSLGETSIAPAICAFLERHPEIELQIDLTDRLINSQEDGYDVVIRRGTPPSSGLIRKALSPDPLILVASPVYLREHGTPASPDDLVQHSCLILGDSMHWDFARRQEQFSVRVSGRLRSDNSELLRHAARSGLGIIRASRQRVGKSVREGYLKRVLAPYDVVGDSTIYALYPGSKHVLPKLRVFLDFLAEWFRHAQARGEPGKGAAEPDSEKRSG